MCNRTDVDFSTDMTSADRVLAKIGGNQTNKSYNLDGLEPSILYDVTVENIISLSIPLIGKFVEDMEEYENDINKIFDGIEGLIALKKLLEQEQKEYSEERTLKIAEMLKDASYNVVWEKTDKYLRSRNFTFSEVRITFKDSSFRKKPALYFYERAVENGSIVAMEEVACLLTRGEGSIKKDLERSTHLREYAAERGNIQSLVYLERDNSYYKKLISKGVYMAEIVLFWRCFKKKRKFFAKIHLDRLLKCCNQLDKDNIINYLREHERNRGDCRKIISYIQGRTKRI